MTVIETSASRIESGAKIDAAIATIAAEYQSILGAETEVLTHHRGQHKRGGDPCTLDWRVIVSKLQRALLEPAATNDVLSVEKATTDHHDNFIACEGVSDI